VQPDFFHQKGASEIYQRLKGGCIPALRDRNRIGSREADAETAISFTEWNMTGRGGV
jgi:hypothetical protein